MSVLGECRLIGNIVPQIKAAEQAISQIQMNLIAKPPLQTRDIWTIRTQSQLADRKRDLALLNLAIDSKLRGCDLVAFQISDVAPQGYCLDKATVRQQKTGKPVTFEITEQSRNAVERFLHETEENRMTTTRRRLRAG